MTDIEIIQFEKELREEIAKEIEAYAKTQEKTMQKAAYECVTIARGEVKK
jgi:meiotically up-regulated gene 157 (Mug157) protein